MSEKWLPIESAPKDGTPVLVFVPFGLLGKPFHQIAVAEYASYLEWCLTHTGSWAEDADLEGKPTHWMPLPAPPGSET